MQLTAAYTGELYMYEKEFVNKLISRMKIEKEKEDRSGIYGYVQRKMAYNSNRIEGSTLT